MVDKITVTEASVVDKLNEYFSRGILSLSERDEADDFSLSIVDLFVRQMHGKISVSSNETEGTVFAIMLPQLEVTES